MPQISLVAPLLVVDKYVPRSAETKFENSSLVDRVEIHVVIPQFHPFVDETRFLEAGLLRLSSKWLRWLREETLDRTIAGETYDAYIKRTILSGQYLGPD
jgi:hypothetical protein